MHCEGLQSKLAAMEARYHDLDVMYARKAEEVLALRYQLQGLQRELNLMKAQQDLSLFLSLTPETYAAFDAF